MTKVLVVIQITVVTATASGCSRFLVKISFPCDFFHFIPVYYLNLYLHRWEYFGQEVDSIALCT